MSGSRGIPTAAPGTGIIVPRVPFVFPDGTLTPISWRFLLGLWKNIGDQATGTDPAFRGGVLAPTSITLSSYTGTLSKTDNLYPTPTMTLQAGVTFGWIVSGY